MERIGLFAGKGELPLHFARRAREHGAKVIVFAIRGVSSPELTQGAHRVHWFGFGEIKKCLLFLKIERIKNLVLLGKIDKSVLYSSAEHYKKPGGIFHKVDNSNDYTVLGRITSELKKWGITVVDGSDHMDDLFPPAGTFTTRQPNEKELADIDYGVVVARGLAALDIGQAIVVKDRAVVSVEAMEGTDATVKRARQVCGPGFSVIKVSRPKQDMRWDVPAIGPDTIRLIAASGGTVLAVEEKRTYIVKPDECKRIADESGISIVILPLNNAEL